MNAETIVVLIALLTACLALVIALSAYLRTKRLEWEIRAMKIKFDPLDSSDEDTPAFLKRQAD